MGPFTKISKFSNKKPATKLVQSTQHEQGNHGTTEISRSASAGAWDLKKKQDVKKGLSGIHVKFRLSQLLLIFLERDATKLDLSINPQIKQLTAHPVFGELHVLLGIKCVD